MTQATLYVGLDTDKRFVDVAVAEPLPGGEVRHWGRVANTAVSLGRVMHRLRGKGRQLRVCYEAGPCGFGIYRRLNAMADVECVVVAPSMTPRRPGDRVKTNRRDALKLARLLRGEELTVAWVPDAAHEAMRDLIRARGQAVGEVKRCQQHISSFLLRQEVGYGGTAWTRKHRAWLGGLKFGFAAQAGMFAEALVALDQAVARRDRLTALIAELAPSWSLFWLVGALQLLRGYRLINAATLAAELGDPRRFATPREIMAYLGMVPSEASSGAKVRRGKLTKTGNGRARTALMEAAWTYTRAIKSRAPAGPPALVAIAEKARDRLSRRYRHLVARGKLKTVAAVAIARESIGFIWAIAQAAGPATRD